MFTYSAAEHFHCHSRRIVFCLLFCDRVLKASQPKSIFVFHRGVLRRRGKYFYRQVNKMSTADAETDFFSASH